MDLPQAVRSLAARSVHIKLYPTARNLAERREVLRVLERFGEVEMFRSMKYHSVPTPNAFLTIFKTESAAREAIDNSPIRYRLITSEPPPPNPDTTSTSTAEHPPPESSLPEQEKSFQMDCSPSSYPHVERLSSPLYNPLAHGFKPAPRRNSAIASALYPVISSSIRKDGFLDWESDGVKKRVIMNKELTTEVPWRVQLRNGGVGMEEIANEEEGDGEGEGEGEGEGKILGSLKELWEKGLEERAAGGGKVS